MLRPQVSKVIGLQVKQHSTAGLSVSRGGLRIWMAVLDGVLMSHCASLKLLLEGLEPDSPPPKSHPQWKASVYAVRLAFDCL